MLWFLLKQQKVNVTSINNIIEAIKNLDNNVVLSNNIIHDNFKDIISKSVVIDTKQDSIKDTVDQIIKGIILYHAETLDIIKEKSNLIYSKVINTKGMVENMHSYLENHEPINTIKDTNDNLILKSTSNKPNTANKPRKLRNIPKIDGDALQSHKQL